MTGSECQKVENGGPFNIRGLLVLHFTYRKLQRHRAVLHAIARLAGLLIKDVGIFFI